MRYFRRRGGNAPAFRLLLGSVVVGAANSAMLAVSSWYGQYGFAFA